MKEHEEKCSIERAEGSTSVVGDGGVCKAKGWNGRWDVLGAGVECKIERKQVVKEAQACLVLRKFAADGQARKYTLLKYPIRLSLHHYANPMPIAPGTG